MFIEAIILIYDSRSLSMFSDNYLSLLSSILTYSSDFRWKLLSDIHILSQYLQPTDYSYNLSLETHIKAAIYD